MASFSASYANTDIQAPITNDFGVQASLIRRGCYCCPHHPDILLFERGRFRGHWKKVEESCPKCDLKNNEVVSIIIKMKKNKKAADIQEECLINLRTVAAINKQDEIANAGGITMILDTMKEHFSIATVQEHGLEALWSLAVNNDRNIEAIVSAEGIETILSAMTNHSPSATVQQYGCRELFNLAVNNTNRFAMAGAGGIKQIIFAMKKHLSNANVQHYGCAALGNLAVNDNNKDLIADEGGITTILDAMETHLSNATVQEYGFAALENLAMNDKNKVAIAQERGITTMLSAMKIHSSDTNVQHYGRKALLILGPFETDNKVASAIACGIVATILLFIFLYLRRAWPEIPIPFVGNNFCYSHSHATFCPSNICKQKQVGDRKSL